MATNKMTKKDYFNNFLNKYPLTSDEIAFCKHEIELLERKNANSGDRKPTATQVENDRLKEVIVAFLVDNEKAYTITDMIKACDDLADLTNQKVSRLANDLVDENKITKFSDKRKTYFKA